MLAPDPLPIRELAEEAQAALADSFSEQWAYDVSRHVRDFVRCAAHDGITRLPDDRLPAFAAEFLARLTIHVASPSEETHALRRAAVRAVCKAGVRRGLDISDPFDSAYDRVVAGEDLSIVRRARVYRPKDVDRTAWAHVQPVFVDICTRAVSADAAVDYERLRSFLSGLLLWSVGEGITLKAEAVLDDRHIDRYLIDRYGLESDSFSSGRSTLYRAALALQPRVVRRPVKRLDPLRGYTEPEVEALTRWGMAALSGGGAGAAMWALLILGLGVGFDTPALRYLKGCHVSRQDDLVVVFDPEVRDVPVAVEPEWAQAVFDLAAEVGPDGYLVHPSYKRRKASSLAGNIIKCAEPRPPDAPHLDCRRLRTTWILGHLLRGTDARVLLRAAGLMCFGSFDRYLDLMEPATAEEVLRGLRGDR